MDNLVEEIKKRFVFRSKFRNSPINDLPESAPAWVIDSSEGFGVFVILDDPELRIYEMSQ
ncbi:MAG: hypothetical protein HUJ54_13770 [Erysipelotrichaceae bacterium]|nr:hypothetical protein [Erysipelotrichaceae bacterium]